MEFTLSTVRHSSTCEALLLAISLVKRNAVLLPKTYSLFSETLYQARYSPLTFRDKNLPPRCLLYPGKDRFNAYKIYPSTRTKLYLCPLPTFSIYRNSFALNMRQRRYIELALSKVKSTLLEKGLDPRDIALLE